MGNKPSTVKGIFTETLSLLKPSPYDPRKASRSSSRSSTTSSTPPGKDGLVGIESHIEDPEESELFKKYPSFHGNHHAVGFLADTMKVLLTGAVEDHHLSEILDLDLDQHHEPGDGRADSACRRVADAMPGFGIVAAVLGVIITMGKIGGSPEEVGESVAAALVGTFLGVLLAYGVVGPSPRRWATGCARRGALHGHASARRCCRSRGATRPSPPWSSPGATSSPRSVPPSPSWRR